MEVACVVLTLNEEPRIEECLKQFRSYVDFILVLDGGSADKTVQIAEKYADKVIVKTSSGSMAKEKNYARDLVPKSCRWILWSDTDEKWDKGFLKKLRYYAKEEEKTCYRFPRVNLPNGKDYPDYQVRLFRNSPDIEWRGEVHEVPWLVSLNTPLDQTLSVITMCKYPIVHLPRRENLKRKWW